MAAAERETAAAERETAAARRPACPHCHRQGEKTPPHDDRTGKHDEQERHKDRTSGGIFWLSALGCQGLMQQWCVVTVSWPGDRHVELGLVLPPCGRVEMPPFLRLFCFPPPPPTPPPNQA